MLCLVDTQLLASLVRAKRASQALRESAEEISRAIGPVSTGTLLRVEQQHVPDLPVFLHLCNWLAVPPARLLYNTEATAVTPAETTAATVTRLLRSDAHLEPAMANVLAIIVEATYAHLATHE